MGKIMNVRNEYRFRRQSKKVQTFNLVLEVVEGSWVDLVAVNKLKR
jgi:hypothetical protein